MHTSRILLVMLCCLFAFRQVQGQSGFPFRIPRAGTASFLTPPPDWQVQLQNLGTEEQDEKADAALLQSRKDSLLRSLHPAPGQAGKHTARTATDTAHSWKGWTANLYNNGTPADNELAVSNSGMMISVMNSTLYKYDVGADTSMGVLSLQSFFSSLGNVQDKYDPKVIYDEGANRFVLVCLGGYLDTTSNIFVAFSESDNPNGNWNFYLVPGNPLNDTLWSDFPSVSLTQQELFITINHIHNNQPWQTAFVRSAIWEIKKNHGYAGDTLGALLHTGIQFNGKNCRNICPVKGGSMLYGPDAWFLSERNFDIRNDTFFLIHLNDTMGAPGQLLTVRPVLADADYFVPVNALQPGPGQHPLQTNDSRVLSAFYENQRIQLVGNTTDTLSGRAAFYHGIITGPDTALGLHLTIIKDDTLHLGYPNIAYAGMNASDQRAIINCLYSNKLTFPGVAALCFDGVNGYSAITKIKQGKNYVSIVSGNERWGDYSGSQRLYGQPGLVWINGSYANTGKKYDTWVAELSLLPPPAGLPAMALESPSVQVFPDPAAGPFQIAFRNEHAGVFQFALYDVQGRLVQRLLQEWVDEGENQFTFSLQPLPAGCYMLTATRAGRVVFSRPLIKN